MTSVDDADLRLQHETERLIYREAYLLDMRDLAMDDGHFQNLDHMNELGASRFTKALVDAVKTDAAKGATKWNAVTRWKGGFDCESESKMKYAIVDLASERAAITDIRV